MRGYAPGGCPLYPSKWDAANCASLFLRNILVLVAMAFTQKTRRKALPHFQKWVPRGYQKT